MIKKNLVRGISSIVTGITAIAIGTTCAINFIFPARIHEFFGTGGNGGAIAADAPYQSDFESVDAMVEARHKHTRNAVAEATVMLRNDGALPLAGGAKVTLLGQASVNLHYNAGSGGSQIANANKVCRRFLPALEDAGFQVNHNLAAFYETQEGRTLGTHDSGEPYKINEVNPSNFTPEALAGLDGYKDVGIIVFAREFGEGNDAQHKGSKAAGYDFDGSGLEFTDEEKALLNWAKGQGFGKLIVILNSDNAIAIGDMKEDPGIGAILQVGGVGYNGIDGVVDVLKGAASPSGKLVDTWARHTLSAPATVNFGDFTYDNVDFISGYVDAQDLVACSKYLVEEEGIYVGYKYYETRYEDLVKGRGNADSAKGSTSGGAWSYDAEMGYPFGFGLSYSSFAQSIESFAVENGSLSMKVKVTNTGSVAGKDVVEVYASTPYGDYEKSVGLEKSAITLLDFEKTDLIEPGEFEEVEIKADLKLLASFDAKGAKTYVLSEGVHYFALGNGAHDALNNVLDYQLDVELDPDIDAAKMVGEGDSSKVRVYEVGALDKTSFATVNGNEVKPLFESADLNHYIPNSVTYLSRSDYDATYPQGYGHLSATEEMAKRLSGKPEVAGDDYGLSDYSDLAASIDASKVGVDQGLDFLDLLEKEYGTDDWVKLVLQIPVEELASFLGKSLSATQKIPSINYLGSLDGDGPSGALGNLPASSGNLATRTYPAQSCAASAWSKQLIAERGYFLGEDSIYIGKANLYGPGANIHRTPFSGRNVEYYSEDGNLSSYLALAQTNAMADKGLLSTLKHFAVNEQETNRGGVSTFANEQAIRENFLRPFYLPCTEGKLSSMMSSFNRIGVDYAGQSEALMKHLLIEEWDYKGYNVTDEAGYVYMQHVDATMVAGTNLYLSTAPRIAKKIQSCLESSLAGDKRFYAACVQSAGKVLHSYLHSNAINSMVGSGAAGAGMAWWQAASLGIDIGLGVISLGLIGLYGYLAVKAKKEENANA